MAKKKPPEDNTPKQRSNKPRDEYDIPIDGAIDLNDLFGGSQPAGPEPKKRRGTDDVFDSLKSKMNPKKPKKEGVAAFLDEMGEADDLYERTKPKGDLGAFLSGAPVEVEEDAFGGPPRRGGLDDFLTGKAEPASRQPARQDVYDIGADDSGTFNIDDDEPAAPAETFDLDAEGADVDLSAWGIGADSTPAPARKPAGSDDAIELDLDGEAIDLSAFAEPSPPPRQASPADETADLEAAAHWGEDLGGEVVDLGEPELYAEAQAEPPPVEEAESLGDMADQIPGGHGDDHHRSLEAEIFGVASPLAMGDFKLPTGAAAEPQAEEPLYDVPAPARKQPRRKQLRQAASSSEPLIIMPRYDMDDFDTPLFPMNDDVTGYTEDFVDLRRPAIPMIASPFDLVDAPVAPPPIELTPRRTATPRAAVTPVVAPPVEIETPPIEDQYEEELVLDEQEVAEVHPVATEPARRPGEVSQYDLLAALSGGEMLPPPTPEEEDLAVSAPVAEDVAEPVAEVEPVATEYEPAELAPEEALEPVAELELEPEQLEEPVALEPTEYEPALELPEDVAVEEPALAEIVEPPAEETEPAYAELEVPQELVEEPLQVDLEYSEEAPAELVAEAPAESEIGSITFVPTEEAVPEPTSVLLDVELEVEEPPPEEPPVAAWQPRTFRYTLSEFPSIDDVLPPLVLPRLSFEPEGPGSEAEAVPR